MNTEIETRLRDDVAACRFVTEAVHYYGSDKDKLAADIEAALDEIGRLRTQLAEVEAELSKAKRQLDDHAEDWAMCGIPHDGQLAKNLLLSDANHKLRDRLATAERERDEAYKAIEQLYQQAHATVEFSDSNEMSMEMEVSCALGMLARNVAVLRADNARLREDKDRLDWIEGGPERHVIGETGCTGAPFFIAQDRADVRTAACGASTVRGAIDKARAALAQTEAKP